MFDEDFKDSKYGNEVEEMMRGAIREMNSIFKQMPKEKLAQIFKDIEKGKQNESPIQLSFAHNSVPASHSGPCQDRLVGWIIDKRGFRERMPLILKAFLNCKDKHKIVIFNVLYWDTFEWEKKWKGSFKTVCRENGAEIYRKFMDGNGAPERIL
jgi:hypothetical protein